MPRLYERGDAVTDEQTPDGRRARDLHFKENNGDKRNASESDETRPPRKRAGGLCPVAAFARGERRHGVEIPANPGGCAWRALIPHCRFRVNDESALLLQCRPVWRAS